MSKWIDKKVSEFINSPIGNYCPSVLFKNAPSRDEYTTTALRNPYTVLGCSGITCEECWNKESVEE